MDIHIYLDQNIVDDISKDYFSLRKTNKVTWVYSNENLAEIRRSGSETRFLDALEKIKARKVELIFNAYFRLTGGARILEYKSPHEEYESYLSNISDCEIDQISDLEFIARLFGADNKDEILTHPDTFENNIKVLLEPYGLYNEETEKEVAKIKDKLISFVNGPLQEVSDLESSREVFGTHKGRAGNLANKDNPIEHIWKIVKDGVNGMSPDQYFGFDPVDKQGYEEWPMFLGIVGCYTMLNILGFRPDDGLTKPKELPGVLSDGSHVAYAAYCHGLLSRDRKLLAKAKAIYRYKNISTRMLSIERKGAN